MLAFLLGMISCLFLLAAIGECYQSELAKARKETDKAREEKEKAVAAATYWRLKLKELENENGWMNK